FALGVFFFSSRRRHTRWPRDWSSDVCSSDLGGGPRLFRAAGSAGTAPGQPRWASGRRGCPGARADRGAAAAAGGNLHRDAGRGEIGRASCRERVEGREWRRWGKEERQGGVDE